MIDAVISQSESIKGLLNAREDTAGCVRVQVKGEELWMFYNDKINLNNLMEDVISLMNASGYTYLEFNRLARTDNAIVFSVVHPQPVKNLTEGDANDK